MVKPDDSQKDELTGLFTRKAFLEAFTAFLNQARGQKMEATFSLVLMDIDRFLSINREYGHAVGDQVLTLVADVLQRESGEDVLVGRYGGDEYVLLFPYTEREQTFLTMERIRLALAGQRVETGKEKPFQGIPISAGVAAFPLDGRTQAELLRKADQALYRAKVTGRAQIRLAYEERMVPKTAHFTQTQLERLTKLAEEHGVSEADLLREAVDDLLTKYGINDIES
jgi:diguanylate cyclase (GGDEF)-like protein